MRLTMDGAASLSTGGTSLVGAPPEMAAGCLGSTGAIKRIRCQFEIARVSDI